VLIAAAKEIISLKKSTGRPPDCEIYLLFSAAEEVTERGAKIVTQGYSFNTAIVVDSSFAEGNGEDPKKCGKMGEGVMIGVSGTLDTALSNEMIKTAKEKNIPYQIEVMPGKTGTNADELSLGRNGAKTVTLSFPIRNMHTAVEVLSLSDIAAAADLIALYIGGYKS
jgi:endoglucanase